MEKRQTRTFETRGPVMPERNYVVQRGEELADFINRVKLGRYIVLFAPRQTGKTTFFRTAMRTLSAAEPVYFPVQLNFERYEGWPLQEFYRDFYERVHEQIEYVFHTRGSALPEVLTRFLENQPPNGNQFTLFKFFKELGRLLDGQRVVLVIDEFDGIPRDALPGFLHTLRDIYLTKDFATPCPYSVGIVGIKGITQLNYDRTISPFNIQDEFHLRNFTPAQVQELFGQYTDEVGQAFAPEVIETLHRQTAGQPFLVNRLAQILTEEIRVPKTETITHSHFAAAHTALLKEDNTNFAHLTANIQRNPRFESILMQIASSEEGIRFNKRDEEMKELVTSGVIAEGADGQCVIVNPIYQACIMEAFQPLFNGLERDYLPEDTHAGFLDYLTPEGHLDMASLLDNFRDFIARIGFRILQVPEIPRESVGQHLLATYLDNFVHIVGAHMYLEVPTGRGRTDLVILHKERKYIVELKLWGGAGLYEAGKQQLAAYLKLEGAVEGYYVVFDHRAAPEPRTETEMIDGSRIRSYVIRVVQERPSDLAEEERGYNRFV